MAELLEFDLDSKYFLITKESLTEEEIENMARILQTFVESKAPMILHIDGTKYELVRKEEE